MYYLDKLTNKIEDLVRTYEEYLWKEDKRELVVLFEINNIIGFYLYDNNELIDEIIISFDKRENRLYKAICLKIFVMLFGNVKIYKDNNTFYNTFQKPYFKLIVIDEEIRKMIDELTFNEGRIKMDNEIVYKIEKSAKRRIYSKSFLDKFTERVEMSKKILRGW